MSNITTYNDLLEERRRLEALLITQKTMLRHDFVLLKEELRPTIDLFSTLRKITHVSRNSTFIGMAMPFVAELLVRNMLPSFSTRVTRVILPFLATKASDFFHNKNGTFFQKLVSKFGRNGS